MNSHPISNILMGMVAGAVVTSAAIILTSKSATQKVKKLEQTTADNVTTMFKM